MKTNISKALLLVALGIIVSSCDKKSKDDFKPMYKEPIYNVREECCRVYAKKVKGYWSTYPETNEDFGTIYLNRVAKLAFAKDLDLDMDLYYPQEPTEQLRPLLLLIHGGAFYNGDKQSIGYPQMGHYFAERGYVVASINYRLGFTPLAAAVDRAGYRALQDAYAAVCYLIDNSDEYGIDTANIFAAGTSAGAITALNLAFMREENRPESSRGTGARKEFSDGIKKVSRAVNQFTKKIGVGNVINADTLCNELGLNTDLGAINAVNHSNYSFRIKAVANMWGSVHDLSMLKNSKQTSVISFHGDADSIVPYDYGYPFDKVLEPCVNNVIDNLPAFLKNVAGQMRNWITDGRPINELAFHPMYGSKSIHNKAISLGMRSELFTVVGGRHSLHVNNDRSMLSNYFEETILPEMSRFFYEELVDGQMVHVEQEPDDVRKFRLIGYENVAELHWAVEGGKVRGKRHAKVVRVKFTDASRHIVTAFGKYKNGVEFKEELVVQ